MSSRNYAYTKTQLYARYLERLSVEQDHKKGDDAFVRSLSHDALSRVNSVLSEVTYERRNYGQGQFYCWPIHALFIEAPIDPWPAVNFPKMFLRAELALRMAVYDDGIK